MGCNLNIVKNTSTTNAVISDIITYELIVSNCSNIKAEDVVVKDLLPEELRFILKSITIDNINDYNSNIISGVNLGNLNPNESKSITFKAQIIKKIDDFIENKAIVEFKYKDQEQEQFNSCWSNTIKVFVKNPNLKVEKYCDKELVQLYDEINYTIKVTNTGDLDLDNLFLIDEISNSIKLVDSTFSIDNKFINSVEIDKGVMLDSLKVGESKEVKYKGLVISGGCNSKIKNKSIVKYLYKLENGYNGCKESNEAICIVDIKPTSFKQIGIDNFITVPYQNPDIEEVNEVNAYVDINKYNIIKTSVAKSTEGQILSGYKLVVHGTINQVVEYSICNSIQSVHSTHNTIPFSSYIVLPQDFKFGSKVEVDANIENIYFNKIDERTLFTNITLFLQAKISYCH